MGSPIIQKFTDLNVWKLGNEFVFDIYRLTATYPDFEKYNLVSQSNRAVVSITSNIAEGFSRYHFKDRIRFYYNSRGSLSEVMNLLIIANGLGYISKQQMDEAYDKARTISIMLNGLIQKTYSFVK